MLFLLILVLLACVVVAWLLIRIESHILNMTQAIFNQTEVLRNIIAAVHNVERAVVSLQPDDEYDLGDS